MAVNLSNWYQGALQHIPNLPANALIDAVREAGRKFCVETWLWKYTLPLINVVANTSAYTLTIPGTLYAELEAVPDDGVRYKKSGATTDEFGNLYCTSEDELDGQFRNWRYQTHPYPSKFYVDNLDSQLHLVPIPENASVLGLEVTCILKPDKTCTTFPNFLYTKYEDVILEGALERLFNRSGSSWYDPEMAAKHGLEFRKGYNEAKMKRFTGATNKPMSLKMRFFA